MPRSEVVRGDFTCRSRGEKIISKSQGWNGLCGWRWFACCRKSRVGHATSSKRELGIESRHLAYYLDGASENDDDLYVMINADKRDLSFAVHEGDPTQWQRVVDTGRKSPADFCEPGKKTALRSAKYVVKGRSIVVLIRHR